jgi:hypothetical protein
LKTSSAGFKAAKLQDQKFIETAGVSSASSAESSDHIINNSDNNGHADGHADALRMPTGPGEHPQNPSDVHEKVNRKKSGGKIAGLSAGHIPRPKPRPK